VAALVICEKQVQTTVVQCWRSKPNQPSATRRGFAPPFTPGEMAALVPIWATMEEDRLVWHGVQMDGDLRMRIVEAAKTASADAIDVSVLDRYKDAA